MLEQFEKIGKNALADLKQVTDMAALEDFRIKYLGRKGKITQMLGRIGKLSTEQKPRAGQLANKIKKEVTKAFDQLKNTLVKSQKQTGELIDVTLPGIAVNVGKTHVITQTLNELLEIFGRMGFAVAYGPVVEDEWHNFVALNIGPDHPARDPFDCFYIDDNVLLRSHR
jgi:phenylalanyl-tRNA synthetase alpha chain